MTKEIPSFRSDYFIIPPKKDQVTPTVAVYVAALQPDGSYMGFAIRFPMPEDQQPYNIDVSEGRFALAAHIFDTVADAMSWVELQYMNFNENVKVEEYPGLGLAHYKQFMDDVFPPVPLEESSAFRSSYFTMRGKGEDSVTVFVARQDENGKFTCVEDNFVVQTGEDITSMEIGPYSGSGVDFFEREVEGLSRLKAIAWIKACEAEVRAQNRYYVDEHRGSDVPHVVDVEEAIAQNKPASKAKKPKTKSPKI